ncbi:hypothetical protein OS493_037222 [Desmophyllum pertusum]|uniref:Complement Clr-like EGF domain-containing protein n=1 Tax=Desmophyllum pertusum TaxID=174260 RepID=A0A9X0D7J2_9CNID|nr:hypothetical protein OS493_037222 [Desmophyllum pertusum]
MPKLEAIPSSNKTATTPMGTNYCTCKAGYKLSSDGKTCEAFQALCFRSIHQATGGMTWTPGLVTRYQLNAPEWLNVAVSETNEAFDIPNIVANLASDLEHCSGFPLNQASSLAYYRPAVNYKLRIAQTK